MSEKISLCDAASILFLVLFGFIASMPSATYYFVLETYIWARIILLLGPGLSAFFQGMEDKRETIFLNLIMTIISLVLVSSMWTTLGSYTYVPSGHSEVTFRTILILIWFFVGSASFYGFGALCKRAIEEMTS